MVEVTRLELTTSWSRTKRATKLRYTSKVFQPKKRISLSSGGKPHLFSLNTIQHFSKKSKRFYLFFKQ